MPELQPEFSCNYCLRKFGSRNAVIAHLRFCELWKIVREARRQASAEPQADVPRQGKPPEEIPRDAARGHGVSTQDREARRSRRPSRESLVTLLKTEEDFMWLNEECQDHIVMQNCWEVYAPIDPPQGNGLRCSMFCSGATNVLSR